jgi:hypothetical protein
VLLLVLFLAVNTDAVSLKERLFRVEPATGGGGSAAATEGGGSAAAKEGGGSAAATEGGSTATASGSATASPTTAAAATGGAAASGSGGAAPAEAATPADNAKATADAVDVSKTVNAAPTPKVTQEEKDQTKAMEELGMKKEAELKKVKRAIAYTEAEHEARKKRTQDMLTGVLPVDCKKKAGDDPTTSIMRNKNPHGKPLYLNSRGQTTSLEKLPPGSAAANSGRYNKIDTKNLPHKLATLQEAKSVATKVKDQLDNLHSGMQAIGLKPASPPPAYLSPEALTANQKS